MALTSYSSTDTGAALLAGLTADKTTLDNRFTQQTPYVVGSSSGVKYQTDGTADEVQINEAIDAATAAGGGTVLLKADTFTLAGSIVMKANVRLMGEGYGTLITGAITPLISISSINNVDFGYFQMYSTKSDARYDLVSAGDVKRMLFDHVWFKSDGNTSGSIAYQVNSSVTTAGDNEDWAFRQCRFENLLTNTVGIGGLLTRGVFGLEVSGCFFSDINNSLVPDNAYNKRGLRWHNNFELYTSSSIPAAEGIDAQRFDNFSVVGNVQHETFSDSSHNHGGIGVTGSSYGVIANNVVIGYSGINVGGTAEVNSPSDVTVTGNTSVLNSDNANNYACQIYNTSRVDRFNIMNNILRDLNSSNNFSKQAGTATEIRVRNNQGHVTENSGTGTISNGATSATITHGLSATPTLDDIAITLGENPTNTPGAIWVDTLTSTQFNVNCENDPGASNLDFGWKAIIL